jgi:hypothetical protein
MAPEVFRHELYNHKVDQYSFAMIAYQVGGWGGGLGRGGGERVSGCSKEAAVAPACFPDLSLSPDPAAVPPLPPRPHPAPFPRPPTSCLRARRRSG